MLAAGGGVGAEDIVERDPVGAAERPPVLVGRRDVVETGQRPEAVAGVVVDGRVIAERAIGFVGIVEEVGGERIELDGGRRHALSTRESAALDAPGRRRFLRARPRSCR